MGVVPAAGMSRQAASIDEILDLYRRWGAQHYDEELSQTSHALQTAACARAEGAADELVAAALLHDVGHLLVMDATGSGAVDPTVDTGHEGSGARYLAGLFPAAVTAPIALHVRRQALPLHPRPHRGRPAVRLARRPASCARVARCLPTRPLASPATRPPTTRCGCGRWDDAGKDLGAEPGSVDDHRALLERVARMQERPGTRGS